MQYANSDLENLVPLWQRELPNRMDIAGVARSILATISVFSQNPAIKSRTPTAEHPPSNLSPKASATGRSGRALGGIDQRARK